MNATATLLQALRTEGSFEPFDVQLAAMMARRSAAATEAADILVLAVALVSRARRLGDTGITLDQLAAETGELREVIEPSLLAMVKDASAWKRALRASVVVGDAAGTTPLVLRDDLLQLRRYHDAEKHIAARIRALLQEPAVGGVHAFSIITGGPGTGKTTQVARMLVDLAKSGSHLRVGLAAPTGKAAARLTESIRQRIDEIRADDGTVVPMPGEARTLHRLLRYSPKTNTYRSTRTDPLDDDLIIVDEASMVDVLLLDALLRAMKPGARMLLVGDHNQLASVETGDVLGALCRAAESGSKALFGERVVTLTHSWRFASQPAIGALASAILTGDIAALQRACDADGDASAARLIAEPRAADALLAPIAQHLNACMDATTPGGLMDALDGFRVLAPEREGRLGVQGINDAIEHWMGRHGRAVHEPWYHGRPVLVTANDYTTGVYNGDLGVVWRQDGEVSVHFRDNDGKTRAVAPIRLPSVETAWAMTVHKAQGSEFDDVMVVVPEHDSRVMSRELLYTAVTRARKCVTIVGGIRSIERAMARRTGRTSGLEARLGALTAAPHSQS